MGFSLGLWILDLTLYVKTKSHRTELDKTSLIQCNLREHKI